MAGRLGEGPYHELRIHGVAGTPPEGMLDDLVPTWPAAGPCGQPLADAALTVWRRQPKPAGLRAYSWSSVTSGSARSALYLLLVPHLLVNMAGWAALPSAPAGVAGIGGGRPARDWPVRIVTLGVRLLALALTVIMAQWALLVGLDLVAYQWAVRIRDLPPWTLGVGVLAAGIVIELVLVVTRLRLRPVMAARDKAMALTDPVGYAWLTTDQHLLWASPQTIALQRQAHHGVALGSIALVAIAMVGGWVPMPQPWLALAAWLGGAATVLGVAAVGQHSLSTGTAGDAGWAWPAHVSRAAGRVGLLAAAVAAAGAHIPASMPAPVAPAAVEGFDSADLSGMAAAGQPVFLPVVRDIGMGLMLGYTLACLAAGLLAWLLRHRPDRTTRHPPGDATAARGPAARTRHGEPDDGGRHGLQAFGLPGLAMLGGAVGGGMGAAIAAATSRLLGTEDAAVVPGPLPEALAITFAALAVLLGWVVVVGLAVHAHTAAGGAAGRQSAVRGSGRVPDDAKPAGVWRVILTTAVHRLLRRGSWLSATLTGLGVIGVAMVTVLVGSPDNPLHVLQGAEPLPQVIVLVAAALVASAIGLAVALVSGRRMSGVGTALLLLGVATIAVLRVPGADLVRQLRPAAMAIGLLTPAGFVLGKGISALRSRSDRRTVAILWDVGTFLPRWFDPLSPPSYGDHVVPDLRDLITEDLARAGPDGQDPTLLLAPHSQGTVIAAAAVLGLPQAVDSDRLALLTYGSPLRHLYAEFFPSLFDHATFVALNARLGGRWRNLARTSDPIGAPVGLDGVDVVLAVDPCGRGHSAYPREDAYDAAVTELRKDLGTVLRIPEHDEVT